MSDISQELGSRKFFSTPTLLNLYIHTKMTLKISQGLSQDFLQLFFKLIFTDPSSLLYSTIFSKDSYRSSFKKNQQTFVSDLKNRSGIFQEAWFFFCNPSTLFIDIASRIYHLFFQDLRKKITEIILGNLWTILKGIPQSLIGRCSDRPDRMLLWSCKD